MKRFLIIWNAFDSFLLKFWKWVIIIGLAIAAALLDYNYQKRIVKDAIQESNKPQ